MTWGDFERLVYHSKTKDSYEWDRVRYLATNILNSRFGVKNSDLKKPTDLFKLPTDVNISSNKPLITKEEFKATSRKLTKLLNASKS